MKKRRIVLLILGILILLHLCGPDLPGSIPLSRDRENIVSIELLHNPENTDVIRVAPICRIEEGEWTAFLDDLQELEARRYFNDPATDLGELVICITYDNGDLDLIGADCNIQVCGGELDYNSWYFRSADFKAFFECWAGDDMPEGVFPWLEEST